MIGEIRTRIFIILIILPLWYFLESWECRWSDGIKETFAAKKAWRSRQRVRYDVKGRFKSEEACDNRWLIFAHATRVFSEDSARTVRTRPMDASLQSDQHRPPYNRLIISACWSTVTLCITALRGLWFDSRLSSLSTSSCRNRRTARCYLESSLRFVNSLHVVGKMDQRSKCIRIIQHAKFRGCMSAFFFNPF